MQKYSIYIPLYSGFNSKTPIGYILPKLVCNGNQVEAITISNKTPGTK
jgi:hypothetical protein